MSNPFHLHISIFLKVFKNQTFKCSMTLISFLLFDQSSFRRPTLLASPTPNYEIQGQGRLAQKIQGRQKIEFFINFNAIFNFKSTSNHFLISMCSKYSLKLIKNTVFQPPLHFQGQPPLPLNFENWGRGSKQGRMAE